MKVCLLCGESYGDPIDFCFRDGEVLASADGRRTPAQQPRSLVATPTPSLAAATGADEDPDVARANRRALMRAAAASYLAPGQDPARLTPSGVAKRDAEAPRFTPVPVSPLDEGLPPWDDDATGEMADGEAGEFDEAFDGPPSRSGAIVAALIGALVVVAIALGVGLLVVVGLGRNPAGPVTTTAMIEKPVPVERDVPRAPEPEEPTVHEAEMWTGPSPEPFVGETPRPTRHDEGPSDEPAAREAVEFLVTLDTGGAAEGALRLFVDGLSQGVLPARVFLTPGDHVFRVVNGHSGTEMLQVTRTIDAGAGTLDAPRELDLSR